MNFKNFEKLVLEMEKEEKITRYTKGKEYSSDDRLNLFKSLGKEIYCPHCKKQLGPEIIFWIFFTKHIRALLSYINSGKTYSESINSRIKDCRIYLSLFRGIINDKKGGKNGL